MNDNMNNSQYKDEYVGIKEKNNNKKTKLIIILVIVLILVILAALFIPSLLKKDSKKKEKALTKDSEIVKELFNNFREDKNGGRLYVFAENYYENDENDDYTMFYKMAVTYDSIPESEFKEIKCSEVEELNMENVSCYELYDCNENDCNKDENAVTRYIPEEVYEKHFKKLFGNTKSFYNRDLILDCYALHYDQNNKRYVEYKNICAESISIVKQEITNVKEDGDKLIIETKGNDEYEALKVDITYTFSKEKSSGNFIFVNRKSSNNIDS